MSKTGRIINESGHVPDSFRPLVDRIFRNLKEMHEADPRAFEQVRTFKVHLNDVEGLVDKYGIFKGNNVPEDGSGRYIIVQVRPDYESNGGMQGDLSRMFLGGKRLTDLFGKGGDGEVRGTIMHELTHWLQRSKGSAEYSNGKRVKDPEFGFDKKLAERVQSMLYLFDPDEMSARLAAYKDSLDATGAEDEKDIVRRDQAFENGGWYMRHFIKFCGKSQLWDMCACVEALVDDTWEKYLKKESVIYALIRYSSNFDGDRYPVTIQKVQFHENDRNGYERCRRSLIIQYAHITMKFKARLFRMLVDKYGDRIRASRKEPLKFAKGEIDAVRAVSPGLNLENIKRRVFKFMSTLGFDTSSWGRSYDVEFWHKLHSVQTVTGDRDVDLFISRWVTH